MIKTVFLVPEEFENVLKVTGTKIIEKEVTMPVKTGFFGRTKMGTRKDSKEVCLYDLDEELISKYPPDVMDQIKLGGHVSDGYPEYCRFSIAHFPNKLFTREFGYTLTDFYNKNQITQDNLISLEYCKKEGKNSCDVTGAYVTWEDKK